MFKAKGVVYEIMHMERRVASVSDVGLCRIYFPSFVPFGLYLEEEADIDTRLNNLENFYHWCANRILTLDRVYAKEILNSLNLKQNGTDRYRAEIALSYRCASITDVFWVRVKGKKIKFADMNLYNNHLSTTFMDIALRGRQYTVQNRELSLDISTNGIFPKAWKRTMDGFQLYKDGGKDPVERELLASQICRCFKADQVLYEKGYFDGEMVSVSENFTSLEYSIVSMEMFAIHAENHYKDFQKYVMRLDEYGFHMMNIIDYLTGNTDRHWGNWGVCVKNKNNKPVSLHKLMDFNQSFHAYDTIEGSICLPMQTFNIRMNQMEAAILGVKRIGINQLQKVPQELFCTLPQFYDMFCKRLALLESYAIKK